MTDPESTSETARQLLADARVLFGEDCGLDYADEGWALGCGLNMSVLVGSVVDHVELSCAGGNLASLTALSLRVEDVLTRGTWDQRCLTDAFLETLAYRLSWHDGGLRSPSAVAIMDTFGPQARRDIYEHGM